MTSHADVVIRRALATDVPAIVRLLADDPLGATRETPDDLSPYEAAFGLVDADPHQLLVVGDRDGEVIATMQLTLVPGLSRRGASRALVEAVRVAAGERGRAFGTRLLEWAESQAREWGCELIQLTSDKSRTDAHRFYERLGYGRTHEGFKKSL